MTVVFGSGGDDRRLQPPRNTRAVVHRQHKVTYSDSYAASIFRSASSKVKPASMTAPTSGNSTVPSSSMRYVNMARCCCWNRFAPWLSAAEPAVMAIKRWPRLENNCSCKRSLGASVRLRVGCHSTSQTHGLLVRNIRSWLTVRPASRPQSRAVANLRGRGTAIFAAC